MYIFCLKSPWLFSPPICIHSTKLRSVNQDLFGWKDGIGALTPFCTAWDHAVSFWLDPILSHSILSPIWVSFHLPLLLPWSPRLSTSFSLMRREAFSPTRESGAITSVSALSAPAAFPLTNACGWAQAVVSWSQSSRLQSSKFQY